MAANLAPASTRATYLRILAAMKPAEIPRPSDNTCPRTTRLGELQLSVLDWDAALSRILDWATSRESRFVAICNAHVTVLAAQQPDYRDVVNRADMATPDGAPVAWMMRRLGVAGQQRINGPDLMWRLCEQAERLKIAVYFYGAGEATLSGLRARCEEAFPGLRAHYYAPPFRSLTPDEDEADVRAINAAQPGLVFVGLGCPKQERWMSAHRGRVHAVMVGVGAAFDFHAGTIRRAPPWMRENGLEWLHRLYSEPRRLWKRYLVTNTLFVLLAGRQLLRHALRRKA